MHLGRDLEQRPCLNEDAMLAGDAATQTKRPIVVEMTDISKRFGPTVANDRVALTLCEGEIHAVLGENGAGKTTLMNILSGMYSPDSGTIAVRGETVRIDSPSDALALGIGTVYQHFTLVPNLTVLENIVLGARGRFILELSEAERGLASMLTEFGLSVSPHVEIRHLSLGERQRVEIIKALLRGSRVLLLDEPTSVLTPVEVDGLFKTLRRLRESGVSVVLITHKLEEALSVSDRVTILRQGRKVGEILPADLAMTSRAAAKQRIVELMFGGAEPVASVLRLNATADRNALLTLRDVNALGDRGAPAVRGLSLELRAGEIFGIAGVDGNGQKELGEVIAGQRRTAGGSVTIGGRDIANRGVPAAIKAGVGYVTDDRLGEGCVPGASVAENVVLKTIAKQPFSNGFWLKRGAINAHAQELVQEFNVKPPGTSTRMTLLSGGNIQKLLLARELAMNPTVLVCNKPTNGLDLQTAQFVLRMLRNQADQGRAVLLISSELDEILEVSDRVGVMYNGELVGVFPRAQAEIETIGRLMLSGRAEAAA